MKLKISKNYISPFTTNYSSSYAYMGGVGALFGGGTSVGKECLLFILFIRKVKS
jgi:hypothetical protein